MFSFLVDVFFFRWRFLIIWRRAKVRSVVVAESERVTKNSNRMSDLVPVFSSCRAFSCVTDVSSLKC